MAAAEDDVASVVGLIRGAWVALSLRAMLELGLPDAMEAPQDLATLAGRTGTEPAVLARLLRVLRDCGLVAPDAAGRYELSDRGRLLRSGEPDDLRSMALMQTWPPALSAWGRLADGVRTGEGVFERIHGTSQWEALAANPAQRSVFNAAMARRGRLQAQAVLEACDLDGVACVVDVGGGTGALLESLLRADEGLRGVLADRPGVAEEAAPRLAAAGLAERCEIAPADFFDRVPSGGDAYVLSNILHDWPDADCGRILEVVHAAMAPGARLWVLERVLDVTPPRPPAAQADLHLLDLNMLVLFGARERTAEEYGALLTAAGFEPPVVHTTATFVDVIEARRPETGADRPG
jgi:O-methyltransferase